MINRRYYVLTFIVLLVVVAVSIFSIAMMIELRRYASFLGSQAKFLMVLSWLIIIMGSLAMGLFTRKSYRFALNLTMVMLVAWLVVNWVLAYKWGLLNTDFLIKIIQLSIPFSMVLTFILMIFSIIIYRRKCKTVNDYIAEALKKTS